MFETLFFWNPLKPPSAICISLPHPVPIGQHSACQRCRPTRLSFIDAEAQRRGNERPYPRTLTQARAFIYPNALFSWLSVTP